MAHESTHTRPGLKTTVYGILRSRPILALRNIVRGLGFRHVELISYGRDLRDLEQERLTKFGCGRPMIEVLNRSHLSNSTEERYSSDDDSNHAKVIQRIEQDDMCLMCTDGKGTVGHVWIHFHEAMFEPLLETTIDLPDHHALIYDLCVKRKHRRRGIGSALIENALQHCKNKGLDEVNAFVETDNIPSRVLFESMGFEVERRIVYSRIIWKRRISYVESKI